MAHGMFGIIWLFLPLIVVLLALCVVVAGVSRRPLPIEQGSRRCSNCATPMSMRRVSIIQSLIFKGRWTCLRCGVRMSKARKAGGAAT
jgi:hypothetical protein